MWRRTVLELVLNLIWLILERVLWEIGYMPLLPFHKNADSTGWPGPWCSESLAEGKVGSDC